MSRRLFRPAPALFLLVLAACSGGDPAEMDAGTTEPDAGATADAGQRAKCPRPENAPSCDHAEECGASGNPPSRCMFCPRYNDNLCALGECLAPAKAALHTVRFDIADLLVQPLSFAGIAVAAETSGGEPLTCADIYAGNTSWAEACYNVVDVSYTQPVNGVGSVYPIFFSSFAAGRRILFVIYAFSQDGAEGAPVGLSCTARDVPEGAGQADVEGDRMRNLP